MINKDNFIIIYNIFTKKFTWKYGSVKVVIEITGNKISLQINIEVHDHFDHGSTNNWVNNCSTQIQLF